jgi:hypothetical protein
MPKLRIRAEIDGARVDQQYRELELIRSTGQVAVVTGAPNTAPRTFDVTSDGRFVGLVAPDQAAAPLGDGLSTAGMAAQRRIEVVLNWQEELKTRVPTK